MNTNLSKIKNFILPFPPSISEKCKNDFATI